LWNRSSSSTSLRIEIMVTPLNSLNRRAEANL
jgi:hypothetical protein